MKHRTVGSKVGEYIMALWPYWVGPAIAIDAMRHRWVELGILIAISALLAATTIRLNLERRDCVKRLIEINETWGEFQKVAPHLLSDWLKVLAILSAVTGSKFQFFIEVVEAKKAKRG